jgi:hypothetical protein
VFRTQEWLNIARDDVWRLRRTPPLVSFLVGLVTISHSYVTRHGKECFQARSKEDAMGFKIIDKTLKYFPKFDSTVCSLLIQLRLAPESSDPLSHLEECIKSLSEYVFQKYC